MKMGGATRHWLGGKRAGTNVPHTAFSPSPLACGDQQREKKKRTRIRREERYGKRYKSRMSSSEAKTTTGRFRTFARANTWMNSRDWPDFEERSRIWYYMSARKRISQTVLLNAKRSRGGTTTTKDLLPLLLGVIRSAFLIPVQVLS